MAGIVDRQPDKRQSSEEWNASRCESRRQDLRLAAWSLIRSESAPGSELPQTTIQARCSQSDYSYGTQVGETETENCEIGSRACGMATTSEAELPPAKHPALVWAAPAKLNMQAVKLWRSRWHQEWIRVTRQRTLV